MIVKNSDLQTFLVLAYFPHANRKLLLHKLLCICNRFNMLTYVFDDKLLYNIIICMIHLELFFFLAFTLIPVTIL